MGGQKILRSQWVINEEMLTASILCDALRDYLIDDNDRLLVTCLDDEDWDGFNLMVDPYTI